jgi:hypothetical protein
MALAPIITLIYKEVGPPPVNLTPYSWLSKAKASGMNKHMGWILILLLWRKIC